MWTRRNALGAISTLPLAACATGRTAPRKLPSFVLVPGTWHGGWVWTPLADRLRMTGARVYSVTCTGVGERHHLLTPETGLETHINDVVNLIEWEELDHVVLVGHSFAGLTITGVADRLRERIASLIYYDAFVPTAQRPAWVMQDAHGQWPQWWQDRKKKFVDGYKMDFFAEYPIEMLVDPVTHPGLAALVKRRLTLHPARQWTDPVSFTNGGWQGITRSYVHCIGQKVRPSSAAMFGPAKGSGWNFVEADTPRLGMRTHTEQTTQLFLHLAAA